MLIRSLICFLFVSFVVGRIVTDTNCDTPGTEYYNPSTMQCERCGDNMIRTEEGFGCVCNSLSILDLPGKCTACTGALESPSSDKLVCLECNANFDLSTRACTCDANEKKIEDSTEINCVSCPSDTVSPKVNSECRLCYAEQTFSAASGTCVCSETDARFAFGRCVKVSETNVLDNRVEFSVQETDSSEPTNFVVSSKNFALIATDCYRMCDFNTSTEKKYEDTSCNCLASLCALTLFSRNSNVCTLYDTIMLRVRGSIDNPHGYTDWPRGLPWLKYTLGSDSVLNDKKLIKTKVMFNKDNSPFELKFYYSSFHPNGTFFGLHRMTEDFLICIPPRNPFQFGNSLSHKCEVNLLRFLRSSENEQRLYEIYLLDSDDELKPIPVRITNSFATDEAILVRRFAFFDVYSSIESGNTLPTVIRYISDISLTVRTTDEKDQIYPPLFTFTYKSRNLDDILKDGKSQTSILTFESVYELDSSTWNSLQVVLSIIFAVFAFFLCVLRIVVWMRKNRNQTMSFLVALFALLVNSFSDVFFWVLFGESAYMYLFFKGQNDVISFAPVAFESTKAFRYLFVFAAASKLFYILFLVFRQTSVSVFFIDWEKSRGKLATQKTISAENKKHEPELAPVSIWRSILATNVWSSLQTTRLSSMCLTMSIVCGFLIGLRVYNTTSDLPFNSSSVDGSHYSIVFIFLVISFIWLLSTLAQILFKRIILNRFVVDPIMNFVDLLSITNTSCLLIDGSSHGYYIHGRSVHSHADTNMLGLNTALKAEEDNLTAGRGLEDNQNQNQSSSSYRGSQQVFEVLFTQSLISEIERLYLYPLQQDRDLSYGKRTTLQSIRFRVSVPAEAVVKAYHALNVFLKRFIDHSNTHTYRIVERKNFFHKLFGIPPSILRAANESLFFKAKRSFAEVVFYGQEYQLMLFDIYVFCLCACFIPGINGVGVAVFVCFVADALVSVLRRRLGKANIAYKTLIDKRFIIH